MLIRVIYDDGRFDMVAPQMLDTLLKAKRVNSFKRTDAWAVVGQDAIRSGSQDYSIPERRDCRSSST